LGAVYFTTLTVNTGHTPSNNRTNNELEWIQNRAVTAISRCHLWICWW